MYTDLSLAFPSELLEAFPGMPGIFPDWLTNGMQVIQVFTLPSAGVGSLRTSFFCGFNEHCQGLWYA